MGLSLAVVVLAAGALAPEGAAPNRAAAQDAWVTARAMEDGPERTDALVVALSADAFEGLSASERTARLELGFAAFLAALDRFAAGEALALAEAMHARAGETWSAFCLEGALRRGFGRYEEADAVLAALPAAARPAPGTDGLAAHLEVLERRCIVAAGAGWRARERALLGRAYVAGGRDAQQILGRLELAAGRYDAAAKLFGGLLTDAREQPLAPASELPAWALRGFGVALLGAPGRRAGE